MENIVLSFFLFLIRCIMSYRIAFENPFIVVYPLLLITLKKKGSLQTSYRDNKNKWGKIGIMLIYFHKNHITYHFSAL